MKYYLLNKEEIKENIWINPILVKTKSLSKIKQYRKLKDKLERLKTQIIKELRDTNNFSYDDKINLFLENQGDEITCSEYNSIKPVGLYDQQEQRIRAYNKTKILKGKLYGNRIKVERDS